MTTDDMKFARDGQLMFGVLPRRYVADSRVVERDNFGKPIRYCVSDGRLGEIEYGPLRPQ